MLYAVMLQYGQRLGLGLLPCIRSTYARLADPVHVSAPRNRASLCNKARPSIVVAAGSAPPNSEQIEMQVQRDQDQDQPAEPAQIDPRMLLAVDHPRHASAKEGHHQIGRQGRERHQYTQN